MLWNIIRDFIVQHITGGHDSLGDGYGCMLGLGYNENNIEWTLYSDEYAVSIGNNNTIYFGDWLATTITIIAMCLIVAFAIWLVRWVFKAVTSAFLLKR